MNLENEKIKKAYDLWAGTFPESLHTSDVERFDKLVLTLLENSDYIAQIEIENTLGRNTEEWIVNTYLTRFSTLSDMYELMMNSGYIKQ